MKDFVKEINIKCQNCNKILNEDEINIPNFSDNGNLICKKCFESNNNNIIKKTDIKINENPLNYKRTLKDLIIDVLNNLLNLSILKKINYTFSLLSFTYCETCGVFLVNNSSLIHSLVQHKVYSINKYTFLKMKKTVDNQKINSKGRFFFVLYYFQNPDILKIQKFNIEEYFPSNNYKFFFFGETIEENKDMINKYIKNSLQNNENNNKEYKIKKGILIGNNIVINGFFLCFEFNDKIEKKYIIQKGFGILIYKQIKYIGYVRLFDSVNSGFSLEIGILDKDNCFEIGEFNEEIKEYPKYSFELGEIVNYSNVNDIVVQRKVYQNIYYDYLKNNMFFKYYEAKKQNYDLIILYNQNLSIIFNKIYDINAIKVKIQILKNNNQREFEKIKKVVLKINEQINSQIKIIPLHKHTEQLFNTHLHNCIVFIKNKNINLLMNDNKNAFIISYNPKNNKNNLEYLIEEKQIIDNYKNLTIFNTIHNYNNFIKIIDDLINLKLENCNILLTNYQDSTKKKYIKINAKNNRFEFYKSDSKTPNKSIECENLNEMKIEDLLTDINLILIPNDVKKHLLKYIDDINKNSQSCFIY